MKLTFITTYHQQTWLQQQCWHTQSTQNQYTQSIGMLNHFMLDTLFGYKRNGQLDKNTMIEKKYNISGQLEKDPRSKWQSMKQTTAPSSQKIAKETQIHSQQQHVSCSNQQ